MRAGRCGAKYCAQTMFKTSAGPGDEAGAKYYTPTIWDDCDGLVLQVNSGGWYGYKKSDCWRTVSVSNRCEGGGYLLSHFRSTIGVAGFNFSVRDGKRWSPRAMATLVVLSLYRFRFFASATQYKVGKAFLKTLTNLFPSFRRVCPCV